MGAQKPLEPFKLQPISLMIIVKIVGRQVLTRLADNRVGRDGYLFSEPQKVDLNSYSNNSQ
jgi:hypothetical protein